MIAATGSAQQTSPSTVKAVDPLSDDEKVIEQLEADLLKAERNTDPTVIDRIFSDDWLNLSPTGLGGNKPAILGNFKDHSGEAPPYTVSTQDMRIYALGDLAVAAYVKVYRAKENGNVAHHDRTDVFSKVGGVWKLRITRTTVHADQ